VTGQLWRDNVRAWALPLGLLLLAATALGVYRVRFADRVGALRIAIERESGELGKLREQRQSLVDLVARAERSRSGIRELYEQRFATESERLTSLIREVKDLAERAGLRLTAIGYPDRELEDYGLIDRSIVFSVNGDYRKLRQFVNFLELSDSFVILQSIQVSGGSNELGLSLELATLFSGRDAAGDSREAPGPAAERPAVRQQGDPAP
jgi:hypothetical protein